MLPLIHRYWLGQFFRYFIITQTIVMVIFVAVDYMTNLDRFLSAGISLLYALGYVCLKIPFMMTQLTPAGVMLAAIVTMGLMNRSNELLALKCGGVSSGLLVIPVIVSGLILAGVMFFAGETLVPVTMARANQIKYGEIKKNSRIHAARENIWIRSNDTIIHVSHYNPADQSVSGITMTRLDDDFQMIRRVDAAGGNYVDGLWHLTGVVDQVFVPEGGESRVTLSEHLSLELEMAPSDLSQLARKTDEMGLSELGRYIRKVEADGYDATAYRVDLYGKTAFPFICLIMAVIGAGVGMRSAVKDNLPLGITLGVILAFLYWILYGFTTSLGYGGVLPPLICAWITNVFFLLAGLFDLARMTG